MSIAAGDRPLAEMGSRRAAEHSAVAAARAAYIAGFGATSNLEAGRVGHPHDGHRRARVDPSARHGGGRVPQPDRGSAPTRRSHRHLRHPHRRRDGDRVAGTGLGGVRIDSGDLPTVAAEVRAQLDELGATGTRITVTSDLDEFAIAALAASPSTPTASAPRWSPDRARRRRAWSTSSSLARMPRWLGRGREGLDRQGVQGGRKAAFRPWTAAPRRASSSPSPTASSAWIPEEHPTPAPAGDARRPRRAGCGVRGRRRRASPRTSRVRPRELPVTALALSRSDPALPTVYVAAR
jgi:nicotinate phosphoribosyltransferase